jgi:stage III sporulation protein AH
MNRPQVVRFAAFVTVLAVLLGYVVYHRTSPSPNAAAYTTVTSQKKSSHNVSNLENYFVNYRMHRDQVMTEEIATLKALTTNPSISQSAKDQATATMVRDTQELKAETQTEGLLSARGFPLSAVTITQNKAVVVVGASHLDSQQIGRIANTITEITSLPPQDVVILPKS